MYENFMPPEVVKLLKTLDELNDAYEKGINVKIKTPNMFIPFNLGEVILKDYLEQSSINGIYRLPNDSHHTKNISHINKEPSQSISQITENIITFQMYLNKLNIPLIYMQLPTKIFPKDKHLLNGLQDIANDFTNEFVYNLRFNNINTIDLREILDDGNSNLQDLFFCSDHHWKPKTAFKAVKILCDKIKEISNIEFNEKNFAIDNYDIEIYPRLFCGDNGKMSGILYTGVDDFELITPKFNTNFTFRCNGIRYEKNGDVKEALMYPSQLNYNYYKSRPYGTYNLVSKHYTQIFNNTIENNNKILIIHDSFANAMASFLANSFKECHFFDIRGSRNRVDLLDIICCVKPDVILIAYIPACVIDSVKTFDINPNKKYTFYNTEKTIKIRLLFIN